MTKPTEIWIVEGVVTDLEAHDGRAQIGDTEWQFSDGPPGRRGSSADYLSLEEGLQAHPGRIFHFVPTIPDDATFRFTVEFEVPYHELKAYWKAWQEHLSPTATMAGILQRDLYDECGMAGQFDVIKTEAPL